MSARTYIAAAAQKDLRHLTVGVFRRSGRKVRIGCRACNHVSEISIASLSLPAALPLSSAPRYVSCAACGASNSDTEQPIYLSGMN